jgi:type II secretory pathway predicted ATPase ExeA
MSASRRGTALVMYENHFGLRRRPFRPLPDRDAYYPATTHELSLHQLLQSIQADEGHMLLTGVPGTGKTLLAHCLLERLDAQTTCAFLTNSHLADRVALLQAILYELSLPHQAQTEQPMRLALTDFLLENFKAGRRGLLIVDEAHHLGIDLLEELRLLGNLESAHGKALQVILIAQPAIHTSLTQPALAALRQRIAVQATLEPLGADEAADYILQQLRSAGGRPEAILTDEALAILVQGSRGIPRILNQSAHQAMLLAHSVGQSEVDAEAALESLNLLGLATEADESEAAGLDSLHETSQSALSEEMAEPELVRRISPNGSDGNRRSAPPRRPA